MTQRAASHLADDSEESKEPKQETLSDSSFISVDGVSNFRDIGGKPCAAQSSQSQHDAIHQKRHIRTGYLFRSAQPTQITDSGTITLTKILGIKHTYDLRSSKELRLVEERYKAATHEIPGSTRHSIPVYRDEDYTPISMAENHKDKEADESSSQSSCGNETPDPRDGFINAYEDILRHAGSGGSYRTILRHILEKPGEPLLWHCTLGKDRTGIFAALLLKLCGTSDGLIVEDYALTTQGLGNWRQYLVKRLMDGAGGEYKHKGVDGTNKRAPTREEAERIVGSHPEDMRAFLEMLQCQFGGARKYFKDECGFTDDELDQVLRNLLVDG